MHRQKQHCQPQCRMRRQAIFSGSFVPVSKYFCTRKASTFVPVRKHFCTSELLPYLQAGLSSADQAALHIPEPCIQSPPLFFSATLSELHIPEPSLSCAYLCKSLLLLLITFGARQYMYTAGDQRFFVKTARQSADSMFISSWWWDLGHNSVHC